MKKFKRDINGNLILVSRTVREIFHDMRIGEHFHGWELKELCCRKHPELSNVYVETFLRQLRQYFHGNYQVVSHAESLYKKIK